MEKKRVPISTETIKNAIKEVEKGLSIRGASKKFGVPYTTLRSKVRG